MVARRLSLGTQVLGWGVMGVMLIPVMATLVRSLLKDSLGGLHSGWTLAWYEKALNDHSLAHALRISLALAAASSIMTLMIGLATALVLWRGPGVIRKTVMAILGALLVIPDLVLGIGLLVWFAQIGSRLHVGFTGYGATFLAHTTASLSMVSLTLLSRLQVLDMELFEAAQDLGAKPWAVLRYVTLPSLGPGMVSAGLLAFTYSFDDFILAFLLGSPSPDMATLPVTLYSMTRFKMGPELFALSVLVMLPVLVVVLVFSRRTTPS